MGQRGHCDRCSAKQSCTLLTIGISLGILNLIRDVRTENGYKILVLDETTEELVFSVLNKSEILNIVTGELRMIL